MAPKKTVKDLKKKAVSPKKAGSIKGGRMLQKPKN